MPSRPQSLMSKKVLEHHAAILSNRVRNTFRHFSKKYRKQNIDCYRLYDWDNPEVRAVVDWYAGHLVVGEYVRWQTGPEWLPKMAATVAQTLNVPLEKLHIRIRRTKTDDEPRYQKLSSKGKPFVVNERDLKFWVNLDNYLDTGLFSDHRDTRQIIKGIAKGEEFLNLFAYTGAFTCAAAIGGARKTVTVDRSDTYLKWAKDNLVLNKLWGPNHSMVQSDVNKFLIKTYQEGRKFTLAVVDPPSFYEDVRKSVKFDINRDHPELLRNTFKLMKPGSTVFFSTNHQRFEPKFNEISFNEIKELTPKTIPEDYHNKQIHRCWRITVK